MYITEKVDGLHVHCLESNILEKVYPSIPNELQHNYEAEYLKDTNIYFIFDTHSLDNEDYISLNYLLRKNHPYIPNYNIIISIDNLENFIKIEKQSYNRYLSENPNKILWWPKAIIPLI